MVQLETDSADVKTTSFCMNLFLRFRTRIQYSTKVVLGLVFLSLLVDSMLLTVVVPILPDFLREVDINEQKKEAEAELLALENNHTKSVNSALRDASLVSVKRLLSRLKHNQDIISENTRVGWLFSSKAMLQFVFNPICAHLVNKKGCTLPLIIGITVMIFSTLLYTVASSYWLLLLGRALHGISASCLSVGGMSLLAYTYTKDHARSKAMGLVLGGQGLGIVIGYPYGGIVYQFAGKAVVFLGILCLLLILLGLFLLATDMSRDDCIHFGGGTKLITLVTDPYILLASGALIFPEMAMALLEVTLPIWLTDNMHLEKWELGMIFLPDSIGFFLGTNAFGIAGLKLGRWICILSSLVLVGACLILIPFATSLPHLILPHFGLGMGLGIVDACVFPMFALLVDQRYVADYGTVYGIGQVSISVAFAAGPSLGSQLAKLMGFAWVIRLAGLVNILYAPLTYFLRNPGQRQENVTMLLMSRSSASLYSEDGGAIESSKRIGSIDRPAY